MKTRILLLMLLVSFRLFCQDINQLYNRNGINYKFQYEHISSDFGVRKYNSHDFHGGVDFATGKRDAIVAHSPGKINRITRGGSGLVDLVVDGGSFYYNYAYRHLFYNSTPPIISNGFILVNVGVSKGGYVIIDTRRNDNIALGSKNGATFKYNNKTYTISNIVKEGQLLAPIGDSGRNFPLHLHLQGIKSPESNLNDDDEAFNPLYYLNYSNLDYSVELESKNALNYIFGTSAIPFKLTAKINNSGEFGSQTNTKYSNCVFDIEKASIQIKRQFKENFEDIVADSPNVIQLGGKPGNSAFPKNILKTGKEYKGDFIKITGIDPHAYYDKGSVFDNFYFHKFIPLISEKDIYGDNQLSLAKYSYDARYPDGDYYIRGYIETIKGKSYNSPSKPIIIDNFHPYIERTLYIYENSEFYRIFWEKKDENTLIKSGEYGNKKFKKGDKIKIAVRTSEPMKEMTVSIIGTSLIDLPMKARTIGKNSWEVDIEYNCNNCNSEEKQLEFKGLDLNNNGLLNDIADISKHLIDRSSSNKSALQKRNNSVGFDRNHKLNSDENCNITANAGTNKTIQQGQNTQLEGRGGSSYSWSPTTGLSNPNIWNPIASPTQTTTYTLTVTENECTDTDTVTITVNDGITNPPPNDDCGNAVTLTSNTSCNNTGGTVADATPSVGANTCEGCMCKSPDDYDVYYKFTAIETSHTVTVSNYVSNFDAVIELRTSCSIGGSNYIGCYDPSGIPSSVRNTWDNLTIGQTYYIRVFEWGYQQSPPSSDTFDICVTHKGTSGGTSGVDFISNIKNVSTDNPKPGDDITIDYEISNIGDTASRFFTAPSFYLSKNQSFNDNSDTHLGNGLLNALINPNKTELLTEQITIPNNVSDGQYYLVLIPDITNSNSDTDNDNNISFYPLYIGDIVKKGSDLDIKDLEISPNTNLAPNQEVEVTIEIENEGNRNADRFDVLIFLDLNKNDEFDANELMREFNFGSLDDGEKRTRIKTMFLPSGITNIGNYQVIAIADVNNDINEIDEDNNDRKQTISIGSIAPAGSDLVVNFDKLEIDATNQNITGQSLCLGEEYTVRYELENIGNLDAVTGGKQIRVRAYISNNRELDGNDISIGSSSIGTTLRIGNSIPRSEDFEIAGFTSGNYFLLLEADTSKIVDEKNEHNNVTVIPITISNCNNITLADLEVAINSISPFDSELGDTININITITNKGNTDANNIDIKAYLSDDNVFHGNYNDDTFNDHTLDGAYTNKMNLNAGESKSIQLEGYTRNDRGIQPRILNTGVHYIYVKVDDSDAINESDKNNNVDFAPINLSSVSCYYNYDDTEHTLESYSWEQKSHFQTMRIVSEENCSWNLSSSESWLSLPVAMGTGTDTVGFSLQENPYPYTRTAEVLVNGEKIYEVVQKAKPCEFLDNTIKLSIEAVISDINNSHFGGIDVTIKNGFPPYSFIWSNNQTTEDLSNIFSSGSYTLIVSDISGCSIEQTFEIEKRGNPIPFDNYTINTTGLTCINSSDGILTIIADGHFVDYAIEIDSPDNSFNETHTLNNSNEWKLNIDYLEGGEYFVYITINGIDESIYKKTFILNLDEPEPLKVEETWGPNPTGKYTVKMTKGTAPFIIKLNNEIIATTNNSEYSFNAQHGDMIEISTAKICEGKFTDTIDVLENIAMHPNPTSDKVYFSIPVIDNISTLDVQLFDINGRLIETFNETIENNQIIISIQHLPMGVYLAKFPSLGETTFKIIKE